MVIGQEYEYLGTFKQTTVNQTFSIVCPNINELAALHKIIFDSVFVINKP